MISQRILRQSIPNGIIKEVLILCAVLLGIYLLRAGMKYYINYYGHVMGVKMQAAMRTDLFEHLEKLPYSFYDNNETGQLMTRMTNDLFDVSELAAILFSSVALILPISSLLFLNAFVIFFLHAMAITNRSGKNANTISESFQLIVQRYANEPSVTNVVIKKFSGPW